MGRDPTKKSPPVSLTAQTRVPIVPSFSTYNEDLSTVVASHYDFLSEEQEKRKEHRYSDHVSSCNLKSMSKISIPTGVVVPIE